MYRWCVNWAVLLQLAFIVNSSGGCIWGCSWGNWCFGNVCFDVGFCSGRDCVFILSVLMFILMEFEFISIW